MSLMQWFKNLFTPRPSAAAAAREGKLPGRNEPCWCGSGKKYKQCHLRKDAEQRVEATYAAQAAKMASRNVEPGAAVTGSGTKAKARRPQEFQEWKGGGKEQ